MLRRVGFFREFYPDHPALPWMRDQMHTKRTRSESEIVAYLRAGHMLVGIMEWSADYFDGAPFDDASGCSSLLTDGTWVWRQDLAHYVERYHLELPTDFIASLVDARFRVPETSAHEIAELAVSEKASLGSDWWTMPREGA
jgi:hypothetical protein